MKRSKADGEEAAPVSEYGQAGQDALAAREREAALAYARRRRLGPFRLRERAERRERDIAAMVRAGFALSACPERHRQRVENTGIPALSAKKTPNYTH